MSVRSKSKMAAASAAGRPEEAFRERALPALAAFVFAGAGGDSCTAVLVTAPTLCQ